MNFLTKIKSYLHQNDNVTLPWEFQENSENTRNARTEILEIYKQEQIFFDQYDDFPFVFENIIDIANQVVQKDPNLGLLHKKLVSKKQEQIIKGFLFSSEWMIINSGKVTLDRLKLSKPNSSFLVFSNLKMRIFKYEKIQKIFICRVFHLDYVYQIDDSKASIQSPKFYQQNIHFLRQNSTDFYSFQTFNFKQELGKNDIPKRILNINSTYRYSNSKDCAN